MKNVTIQFSNSIDKVQTFVDIIRKYDSDFDMVSGRYTIDAKSILGIFSLDLTRPIGLTIYNDEEVPAILEEIDSYLVK